MGVYPSQVAVNNAWHFNGTILWQPWTASGGGPGPTTCFHPTTTIHINSNSIAYLEDLREGDPILSYNFETGKVENDVIKEMQYVVNKNLGCSTFTDTRPIKHTVDHPFWVKGKGWSSLQPSLSNDERHLLPTHEIQLLEKGDKVILFDGDEVKESIFLDHEKGSKDDKLVMTISKLKYNKAFFAGGILAGVYGTREK